MALCELFPFLVCHLPLLLAAVTLITHYYLWHFLRLRLIDLFEPQLHISKGFLIINRVNQNYSRRSFIVGWGDSPISLLSCSVPDLHFDFFVIHNHSFNFEVDSYRRGVEHFVLLVDLSEQNVGFSDSWVTYDDHLYQIVVFLGCSLLEWHWIKNYIKEY